jgi:hypothetical protein
MTRMVAKPRLHLLVPESSPAVGRTSTTDPLSTQEQDAIVALFEAGVLPPDAAGPRWADRAPPRWTWGHAVGLLVWMLAAVGLWSLFS